MRKVLFALMAVAASLALWTAVVGGIDVRIAGVPLRSRGVLRPLLVLAAVIVVYAAADRAAFAADVDRVGRALRRAASWIALACALVITGFALQWSTYAAGGADAFGYVSQAYGWLRGGLPRPHPLPATVSWPAAAATFAPLGYRAAGDDAAIVPTYPPGLPLIMAAFAIVAGACGPYLVVPLSTGLLVWMTFLLGRRLHGPLTGAVAALLVTASPIVLFQALWPMTDVPIATVWTAAAVVALRASRSGAAGAGALAAVAMLIRPNLWPLPIVFAVYFVLTGSTRREGVLRAATFSVLVAPAVIAVAALNTLWYGGPLNSGYGASDDLYSLRSIWPNLQRYPVWLVRSHSILVVLCVAPLFLGRGSGAKRSGLWLAYAAIAATWLSYLTYFAFEDWWYLRFLMPAVVIMLTLAAAAIVTLGRGLRQPWGSLVAGGLIACLLLAEVRFALGLRLFGLVQEEQRYVTVGLYLKDRLPPRAIVVAIQHSGSARFYSGRPTVRLDAIDRSWTRRAPQVMLEAGYAPYAVFDDWELPQVRELLGLGVDAPLPWTLIARMRDPVGLSVFDLAPKGQTAVPVALANGPIRRCVPPAGY